MADSLRSTIMADHRQLQASRERYDDRYSESGTSAATAVVRDIVVHVGFQQLAVFRLASSLHRRRLTPLAMVVCRLIRLVYSAEMHWAADLQPGVLLVHGNGLVVSRSARVDAGCVLSQNVTLGISRGRDGKSGAPHLHENVHVAPGAVIIGPIVIGANSKIAPNTVVLESVAANSVISSGAAIVESRGGAKRQNAGGSAIEGTST